MTTIKAADAATAAIYRFKPDEQTLVFACADGRPALTFYRDGRFEAAPDMTADEAAATAIDAIGKIWKGAVTLPDRAEAPNAGTLAATLRRILNKRVADDFSSTAYYMALEAAEALGETIPKPPHVELRDGYANAFYEIAKLLGIGVQPASPKHVFETQMLPRLRELIAAAASTPANLPGTTGGLFGPYGWLIKPKDLSEEHWSLSQDPSQFPAEEDSIPLYAKTGQRLGHPPQATDEAAKGGVEPIGALPFSIQAGIDGALYAVFASSTEAEAHRSTFAGLDVANFDGFENAYRISPATPAPSEATSGQATDEAAKGGVVDEIDVTGWGVWKGHAIPVAVARHIAAKINERIAATPAPSEATSGDVAGWRDMASAPRNGTMVMLKVKPGIGVDDAWTPFEDSTSPYLTIGFNNLDNTEEDRWQFAGWDWSQDCIIEGAGEVIAWASLASLDQREDTAND